MKAQMHSFKNADVHAEQVCYVYHENRILMIEKRLPIASELTPTLPEAEPVFRLNNGWAFSAHELGERPPKNSEFHSLRDAFDLMAAPLAQDALLGAQLVNWSGITLHCSRCGAGLQPDGGELFKICVSCRTPYYPQLTPVVIVLVKRGRDLLLAKGLPPRKHYSCLAGFVEPGETLEESIRREVKEEAGVEIRNIRYFGSQPWPFPNNLMLAFTAEWVAGEITVDEKELTHAGWFNKDHLPEVLPPKVSIARQMIDVALRA